METYLERRRRLEEVRFGKKESLEQTSMAALETSDLPCSILGVGG